MSRRIRTRSSAFVGGRRFYAPIKISNEKATRYGNAPSRRGIKHLVNLIHGGENHREMRLSLSHRGPSVRQLAGTYSPELPHVVTRRRSSACQVITLTRMIPSGSDNLSLGVVAR